MNCKKASELVEYKDENGSPTTLYRLVRSEPDWACSIINYYVDKIAELESRVADLEVELEISLRTISDIEAEVIGALATEYERGRKDHQVRTVRSIEEIDPLGKGYHPQYKRGFERGICIAAQTVREQEIDE